MFNLFKLSVLLSVSDANLGLWLTSEDAAVESIPAMCNRIECPVYDLIHVGNGYEIRRYNSSYWASTSPIDDISLYDAIRTGFLRLFKYIQGKTDYQEKIEMTT